MDNQTDDNSTSFKEQFDPSLVSEIIISVDAGDKKSLLSIIKNIVTFHYMTNHTFLSHFLSHH